MINRISPKYFPFSLQVILGMGGQKQYENKTTMMAFLFLRVTLHQVRLGRHTSLVANQVGACLRFL